jgi:hypothetical protein
MDKNGLHMLRPKFETVARAVAAGAFPSLEATTYADALAALQSGDPAAARSVIDAYELLTGAGNTSST